MNKEQIRRRYMMQSVEEQGGLPSDYQRVEYIESTGSGDSGTQWIDTKYKANANTSAEYEFNYSVISTYGRHILSGSIYYFPLMRTLSGSQLFSWRSEGGTLQTSSLIGQVNTRYRFKAFVGNNYVEINDNVYGSISNSGALQDNYNLYLFGYNNNGSVGAIPIGKLYYCKIYESGVLVRDYIPCYRKSDYRVGLYDLVNGVFYDSETTDNFLMGRPLVYDTIQGYQQVDYLESTGTQYIDTLYRTTTDDQKLETQVRMITSGSGRWAGVFKLNIGNSISVAPSSNKIWFGRNGDYYTSTTYADGDILSLRAVAKNQNIKGYVNGVNVLDSAYTLNKSSYNPPYNYYLFAQNYGDNNNSAWGMGKSVMYYFRLYDGGNLVRNYVPMRRIVDGELGLYDIVNNEFYTNQGSGTFTKGNYI